MTDLQRFFKTILPISPYYILTYSVQNVSEKTGKPVTYMTNVVTKAEQFSYSLERLFSVNIPRQRDLHFATAGYDIKGFDERIADIQKHISDPRQQAIEIRKYMNSVRQADFITARKCLYIDIDMFKDGEVPESGLNDHGKRVFVDQKEMLKAVNAAVKNLGLPFPSYVVTTGGGVHIYWALSEAISNDDWRYMQMQLAYCFFINANIDIDMQPMKNANGTMRVPTSYSNKRGIYTKLYGEGKAVDLYDLVDLLDSKHPRNTIVLNHNANDMFKGKELPEHLKHNRHDFSLTEWGMKDELMPQWEHIVGHGGCQLAEWASSQEGQPEVGNRDWVAMLSWAKHCEDGNEIIHEISCHHPQYSPEETDYRASTLASVTSCQTAADILNGKVLNPKCKGCIYLGKGNVPTIKNPLEISRRILMGKQVEEIEQDTTPKALVKINTTPEVSVGTSVPTVRAEEDAPLELDSDVLTDTVVKRFMPKDFTILDPEKLQGYHDDDYPAGIGYKMVDPDYPDIVQIVRVTVGFIYVVDIVRDSGTSSLQYDFAVQQSDNTLVSLRVSAVELASDEEVIKRFADVGVDYHLHSSKSKRNKTALFLDYVRQSVAKRNQMAEFTSNLKQYGWTADRKAFLLGNWLIYGGERRERAHPSRACNRFLDALTPKPTARVHKWAEAAKIYSHTGMEAAQFIMGVSLASPVLGLLGTADAQGALINIFSTASGLGKTTLAHSALSIWGRAATVGGRDGLAGISSDTNKARIFGMSLLQNIPYYMDETTDMTARQCYQLVYQITQGQDARRMKQSGTETHDIIGGWNMCAWSSSNKSMVEKLYTEAGASADAVHARVLEINMATLRSAREVMAHDDIQSAFLSMQSENYGIVGQDYLVRVANKTNQLVEEFTKIRNELNAIFDFAPHERFWANTATMGIMGIRHGNHFGYFSYDEANVIEWLKGALNATRIERNESHTTVLEAVEQFISDKEPDAINATSQRKAMWVSGRPAQLPSYRNNIYECMFELHKHSFELFVSERYGWTPKEVANMMLGQFGKPIRSRILSGIMTGTQDAETTLVQPRVDVWRVPYNAINNNAEN